MSSLFGFNAPANFSVTATEASVTEPFYVLATGSAGGGTVTSVTGEFGQIVVANSSGPVPVVSLAPLDPAIIGSYTNADIVTDSLGRINAALSVTDFTTSLAGTANQTSVTAGANPIISLAAPSPAPTAGSYTNASVSVDAFGRITAAASGSGGGGGVVSIAGTPNQIVVTNGTTTPVISLDVPIGSPAGTYTNANLQVDEYGRVVQASNGPPGIYTLQHGTITIPNGGNTSANVTVANGQTIFGTALISLLTGVNDLQYAVVSVNPTTFYVKTASGNLVSADTVYNWFALCS